MTRTSNSQTGSTNNSTIKFLYSYGGKIIPRRTDGKLCYVGGLTRILSVDRSITFSEVMVKFGELCGKSMSLKCKLPDEDLDVLVSIKCDADLVNVIEEYDRFSSSTNQDLKIRAILFPLTSLKKVSPPVSPVSTLDFASLSPPAAAAYGYAGRRIPPSVGFPVRVGKGVEKLQFYPCCVQGRPAHMYAGHQRNRIF